MSIHNILSGTSYNYTSIWADSNANINYGKFYTSTTGSGAAFSVVDLQLKTLVDSYTIDTTGINGEMLDSDDIVDINISIVGV